MARFPILLALGFALFCGACGGDVKTKYVTGSFDDQQIAALDFDSDGIGLADDCDDRNAEVNPGAKEIPYNGVDDDCDFATADLDADGDGYILTDDCADGDAAAYASYAAYRDADGDGFAGTPAQLCTGESSLPEGYYTEAPDCDDSNAAARPGAAAKEPRLCTVDLDADGYGDETPPGTAESGSDCLDTDPAAVTKITGFIDADFDGWGGRTVLEVCGAIQLPIALVDTNTDCDDANATVHPGQREFPDDGTDNDCAEGDAKALALGGKFVDPAASCPGTGTVAAPYCSLAAPVTGAAAGTRFFVARGILAGGFTVSRNVELYGGYEQANWTGRDFTPYASTISGNVKLEGASYAVTAMTAVIDGFTIHGTGDPLLSMTKLTGDAAHLHLRKTANGIGFYAMAADLRVQDTRVDVAATSTAVGVVISSTNHFAVPPVAGTRLRIERSRIALASVTQELVGISAGDHTTVKIADSTVTTGNTKWNDNWAYRGGARVSVVRSSLLSGNVTGTSGTPDAGDNAAGFNLTRAFDVAKPADEIYHAEIIDSRIYAGRGHTSYGVDVDPDAGAVRITGSEIGILLPIVSGDNVGILAEHDDRLDIAASTVFVTSARAATGIRKTKNVMTLAASTVNVYSSDPTAEVRGIGLEAAALYGTNCTIIASSKTTDATRVVPVDVNGGLSAAELSDCNVASQTSW